MSNDDAKRGAMEPPKKHPTNKAIRAVARSAAGLVPGAGSTIAEITDACIPDYEARERDQWESEITHGVNALRSHMNEMHDRHGRNEIELTGAAAWAAHYTVKHCPDGLGSDWVAVDDMMEADPPYSSDQLLEAIGDLESYGFIESRALINAPLRVRLTHIGYQRLDKPIMGWDTEEDARRIAAEVIKTRSGVRTSDLEAVLGWPRRRLNPALQIVIAFIHPGRVSQADQPDYVTMHFSPSNAELATLRRFAISK
jgi:hypothetical protein